MPRKLRHIPFPNAILEVTIRCFQQRFLLRPDAELNELLLGVLGRALALYPSIRLYQFKFASNHIHLILAAPDTNTLALFMNHVASNLGREAGRFYDWDGKFWQRRYDSAPIEDDESLIGKTKYVLAHGCKEDLVASPLDWPGASSDRALLYGEKLEGIWYDRAAFGEAERRGKDVRLADFAIRYEVPLTRLPILEDKSEAEVRAFYQQLVDDIEHETHRHCIDEGKSLLGVQAVLDKDPFDRSRKPKRGPAPLCHAATEQRRAAYRRAYQEFVALYRRAVERLHSGASDVAFPSGGFLPPLLYQPEPNVMPVPATG